MVGFDILQPRQSCTSFSRVYRQCALVRKVFLVRTPLGFINFSLSACLLAFSRLVLVKSIIFASTNNGNFDGRQDFQQLGQLLQSKTKHIPSSNLMKMAGLAELDA